MPPTKKAIIINFSGTLITWAMPSALQVRVEGYLWKSQRQVLKRAWLFLMLELYFSTEASGNVTMKDLTPINFPYDVP